MSRLLHYSSKPITLDRSHTYGPRGFGKPPGLWVSVEGDRDWREWCEGEEFALESLAHAHEVTLTPSAKVLRVDASPGAFDMFEANYAPLLQEATATWDWSKLRAEHDGVIIAPYRFDRRFSSFWYYGWDCASGVIWNLDAIAELRLTTEKAR